MATKTLENFSPDAQRVIRAMMLFGDTDGLQLIGSSSIRAILWPADIDMHQFVTRNGKPANIIKSIAKEFKDIVLRIRKIPTAHLADVKIGECPDGEPLRWTAQEILKGQKGGVSLDEALVLPGITKVDVIALIDGRYCEFSCIYKFFEKKTRLNPPSSTDSDAELAESARQQIAEGNYWKALKRIYSLAKSNESEPVLRHLLPVINSDMGILAQVISDIDTLLLLLEGGGLNGLDRKSIRAEIGNFIGRLSHIYQFKDYLRDEKGILSDILAAMRAPDAEMPKLLEQLRNHLNKYLQLHARKFLDSQGKTE